MQTNPLFRSLSTLSFSSVVSRIPPLRMKCLAREYRLCVARSCVKSEQGILIFFLFTSFVLLVTHDHIHTVEFCCVTKPWRAAFHFVLSCKSSFKLSEISFFVVCQVSSTQSESIRFCISDSGIVSSPQNNPLRNSKTFRFSNFVREILTNYKYANMIYDRNDQVCHHKPFRIDWTAIEYFMPLCRVVSVHNLTEFVFIISFSVIEFQLIFYHVKSAIHSCLLTDFSLRTSWQLYVNLVHNGSIKYRTESDEVFKIIKYVKEKRIKIKKYIINT